VHRVKQGINNEVYTCGCVALLTTQRMTLGQHFVILLCNIGSVSADCYGANTTSYEYSCSGYAKAGYVCVGEECAVDKCVGDCSTCAQHYPGLVVNPSRGQCCESATSSNCMNGDSGYINYPYGFPDHAAA
jgi:hypothetical protein